MVESRYSRNIPGFEKDVAICVNATGVAASKILNFDLETKVNYSAF